MKKFTMQTIFLVIIIFLALAIATSKISTNAPFLAQVLPPSQRDRVKEIKIGNTIAQIEVADTKDKRSKGLGGRESLASNSGMLFIFPKEDKYAFWMKGLKFPLDMIWIRKNIVVDIIKNAKPPLQNQKDETLPTYLPREQVDMVLEVNASFVDIHGIKINDVVEVINQ